MLPRSDLTSGNINNINEKTVSTATDLPILHVPRSKVRQFSSQCPTVFQIGSTACTCPPGEVCWHLVLNLLSAPWAGSIQSGRSHLLSAAIPEGLWILMYSLYWMCLQDSGWRWEKRANSQVDVHHAAFHIGLQVFGVDLLSFLSKYASEHQYCNHRSLSRISVTIHPTDTKQDSMPLGNYKNSLANIIVACSAGCKQVIWCAVNLLIDSSWVLQFTWQHIKFWLANSKSKWNQCCLVQRSKSIID